MIFIIFSTRLQLLRIFHPMKMSLSRSLAACCLILFTTVLHAQPADTNQVDALGKKQGYWKKYVKDTLKYEGAFRDDVPVGEFKYYYPEKKIKSTVTYSDKGLKAVTVNYRENGSKMAEGQYWDKKKNGTWKYYNESGFLTLEENYKNGVADGVWTVYYEDGKPAEVKTWVNGRPHGPFIQFYPDSLVNIKGNYNNGKLDGPVSHYYLNGKVLVSGAFKEDMKDGVWMYFTEIGQADKRHTWSSGSLVKEEITTRESGKAVLYLDIDKIAYVFNNQGKVTIRMNDGTDYISERTIEEFTRLLNEYKFYRVNANYIISLWSLQNRKTYSVYERMVVLKPASAAAVFVSDDCAEGFRHWAGLIKGEVDPKNPQD